MVLKYWRLAAALALMVLTYAVATSAHGTDPERGKVTQWDTNVSVSSPVAIPASPTAATYSGKVRVWRTRAVARSPQQLDPATLRAAWWRRTMRVSVTGTNAGLAAIGGWLIRGSMSLPWDYDGYHINNVGLNTWCSVSNYGSAFQWHCKADKATSVAKGSGGITASRPYEYAYRRAAFSWYQGPIYSLSIAHSAWTSATVRGNGSCVADKYGHAGQIAC